MSLLQQFSTQGDPPVPHLTRAATPIAISLRQQPSNDVSAPTRAALPSFTQWLAIIHPLPVLSAPRDFRELLALFLDEQTQIVENPTSSQRAGDLLLTSWNAPYKEIGQESVLSAVEQAYVLDDRSDIPAFIRRNRLLELLLEAREPLTSAFGEATVKKLTLVEDDEGFITLFCLVLAPGSLDEAKGALNLFDERWWLAHSQQADGKLNFDFELI